MRAIASDRVTLTAALLLAALVSPLSAQKPAAPGKSASGQIQASEVDISRDAASLSLDLANDSHVRLALRNGHVVVDGEDVGDYARGSKLEDSWRTLLQQAAAMAGDSLRGLLLDWSPPASDAAGSRLDLALRSALGGAPVAVAGSVAADTQASARSGQDVQQLQARVQELEQLVQQLKKNPGGPAIPLRREAPWTRPFHYLLNGFTGVISTLLVYAILLGLGFASVFFGRRYLEGVADTARHHTMRSWIVGMAGSFLALPVFILGIIALAISIVGIPLLIAWVPVFPVGVVLAAVFGYLAVAHAAGEAMAERRLEGADWLSRGNSYYYLMTGLALLLVLFLAANVVSMAGPWLGFIRGTLNFIGAVLTWAAFTIGFGAVLLSRAGTRPLNGRHPLGPDDAAASASEPSHV
jgi:hypothetical protein